MKLEILYVPTTNLEASLAFYRDRLGWTELWREGATTAALTSGDGDIQVMLDADPDAPMGPMFVVDSVLAQHETMPTGVEVLAKPAEIPGGWLATYREPGGSVLYVIDQSTDAQKA
ncbi:VOC family protein [Propionibacteriaceae bacterium Y1700]|uniref:VOC family protein n=1 Tax=Microlunatus sp. Y1700 TaxID=3418487 RepID=UPI003DA70D3A